MHHPQLYLLMLVLLLFVWTVYADGNETPGQNGGNLSQNMIFSFTNATRTDAGSGTMASGEPAKNQSGSLEEYYNQLGKDSDTEPLHLSFQGIPMECHFCRK
ncbi:MAG: hypothetical protein LUQ07_05965 [Methanospirillum sp.]|nr:hypothetical protein [Methanospirillum sp.]